MTDEIRCSIEVRESGDSPGRLHGVLLTYNEKAGDRPETFESGALSWPSNGVILRRQHQRGQPIARVMPEVRGDQVVIDQPLPDTAAGRDAAAEIRAGLLPGLSVEFRSTRERMAGGIRRIASALLTGAGLVDSPSYEGSRVEVRQRGRRGAAMAVDLAAVALHVDGKTPDKLKDRERGDLSGLLAWSTEMVDRYIGRATVPDSIRDAAILRLCYFDYHVRLTRKPADGGTLDQPVKRDLSLNPMRASGAMALLSPWKRRRAAS